jgi:AcrR family transcriptional regulator
VGDEATGSPNRTDLPAEPARRGPRGGPAKSAKPTVRRADAERNVTAILDAALACFNRTPDATMTEIAKEAGVGRVTVYGHFASREDLIDALMARSLAEVETTFAGLGLDTVPAPEAVRRLMHVPWLLGRYRGLYAAGTRYLGAKKVRRLHDDVFGRIEGVFVRGREEGAFRVDQPLEWLVAVAYALAHAALSEVDEDRLGGEEAAELVTQTLLDLLRPPANAERTK